MRILMVTPEYPPHAGGGILKYYATLARALNAAGADVRVLVATPFSAFEDYDDRGVRVSFVPLADVQRHADHLTHLAAAPTYRRWLAAGLAASDWIRREGDDVDIIEVTDFGLLFAPLVCRSDRPPVVVAFHGSVGQIAEHEPVTAAQELDGALARLTEAVLLPHAESLYANSPANARAWASQLDCAVDCLPPPLAIPGHRRAAVTDPAALAVGRIQAWKGPEFLCRALQAVGDRLPGDLTVQWVGRDTTSAPDQQSMNDWLARHYPAMWNRRVQPVGPRPGEEVARLQSAARFVVVPSTWDVFNYTLVESMAAGNVVVASAGAGSSYLVEHGVNGFCVEADQPEAFGDALLTAHALSAAARAAMGDAARATVAQALDPAAAAERSLRLFTQTIDAGRKAPPARWIREFLQPSADRTVTTDHLEQVAIRELAAHLTSRLIRKVTS